MRGRCEYHILKMAYFIDYFKIKFLRNLLRLGCISSLFFASNGAYASASLKPDVMFRVWGMPITNSMLTAAAFCIFIALFFRFVLLKGGAKEVPSKGQVIVETLIDAIGNVLSPIMGKRTYKGAAPYLICLFTFILAMNLGSLLPGVGTIGEEKTQIVSAEDAPKYEAQGFHIEHMESGELKAEKFSPFIRPAHTDLNMTLALSLISFFLFFYFVKKYAGFGALYHDWFGNKANKSEVPALMYYMLFPIFFAVGFIEVISACVRPISLSFRLFGNVFGGETLLEAMHSMAWSGGAMQFISWLVPLPFYFLELLVACVQAFVFTLLTALYIGLITNHGEDHDARPSGETLKLEHSEALEQTLSEK